MRTVTRAALALAAALMVTGCVAPAVRLPAVPSPAGADDAPAPAALPAQPLATLIAGRPDLTGFRALAAAGGLDMMVAPRGPVTILAPSDAAFARLIPGTTEALLLPGNRPSLLHLLRFWIVRAAPTTLMTDGPAHLMTADGEFVDVLPLQSGTVLADAAGRRSGIVVLPASDGALVVLDRVIAPRSIEPGGPVPLKPRPADQRRNLGLAPARRCRVVRIPRLYPM